MLHQTIEKLHALKLSAMADSLLAQSRQPGIEALDFERLALLVDVRARPPTTRRWASG